MPDTGRRWHLARLQLTPRASSPRTSRLVRVQGLALATTLKAVRTPKRQVFAATARARTQFAVGFRRGLVSRMGAKRRLGQIIGQCAGEICREPA